MIALLPREVNLRTVEEAHARAMRAEEERRFGFQDQGMRLARLRHPQFMVALNKAAEVMDKAAEDQYGRTMRSPGQAHALKSKPTEVSLWREAYRLADEGKPIANFGWIYGAAGWLAGLVSGV